MPEEHASPTDLDEERVARIKDAQLRGAKTRRLKTEQRALNAFLQLGRCEDPDQKITVALICRQAGHMSQATFYGRFSGGTGDLLKIAAEQMRDDVNARVHKDLKAHPGIVSQNLRVTIAISRLVELLLEFPNLFNVDRIIPKLAIYALAETLFDAIVGDAPKSEAERERATVIAKYHTTSLIGILRTSLGDHIERSVFAIRLAERMISQVLPVLTGDDLAYRDEEQVVALLLAKSPTVAASARELKQTPLRS